MLTETEDHKKECGKKISLARGKNYGILTPEGEKLEVRALAYWCRQKFGEKGNSASVTLHQRGKYQGYTLLGEISPSDEN